MEWLLVKLKYIRLEGTIGSQVEKKWSFLEKKINNCVFSKKGLFFGRKKNLIQVLQDTLYFSIGRIAERVIPESWVSVIGFGNLVSITGSRFEFETSKLYYKFH